MRTLIFKEPEKLYFTSDPHYGHANIMKFCNRPFKDVSHMNQSLIENWNSVIKEDDICFILGDFTMHGKQSWENLLDNLLGNKILIVGNHDKSNCISYDKFVAVYEGFVNISVLDEGKEQLITLCHYPMLSWSQSHRGAWQLFGHWHNKKINAPTDSGENILEANREVSDYVKEEFLYMERTRPTQYDVGVDGNDYTPIPYLNIKRTILRQLELAVGRPTK